MGLLYRLHRAWSQHGIKAVVYRIYAAWIDRWFDLRYGVDTCGKVSLDKLSISGEHRSQGHRYEPARVVEIRRLLGSMRRLVSADSVLVDLGAGKGRILLLAAESGFAYATGVEFASELCEIARNNCRKYQQKTGSSTRFQIEERDVVSYEFNERDSVFVLFNPFGDRVMSEVLGRLEQSLARHPRKVYICLYNTSSQLLAERSATFELFDNAGRFGYQLMIYSNRL